MERVALQRVKGKALLLLGNSRPPPPESCLNQDVSKDVEETIRTMTDPHVSLNSSVTRFCLLGPVFVSFWVEEKRNIYFLALRGRWKRVPIQFDCVEGQQLCVCNAFSFGFDDETRATKVVVTFCELKRVGAPSTFCF